MFNKNNLFIILFIASASASVTVDAQQPDAHVQKEQSRKACMEARQVRNHKIQYESEIKPAIPLGRPGNTACFSPSENLYYTALIAAQNMLGINAPWYGQARFDSRQKAEQACNAMGYEGDQLNKKLDQCIRERFTGLMKQYDERYRLETTAYISRRNARGTQLVKQCREAFHRKIPELPRTIYFPLAYYDRKVHSFPEEFLKKHMGDMTWLQQIGSVKNSDILRALIGEQCPGEMIWWLYTSS